MMKLIPLLMIFLIGACAPTHSILVPVDKPLSVWKSPIDLKPQSELFKNAEGYQTQRYSIDIDLGDSKVLHVTRSSLEPNAASYSTILSELYPEKTAEPGPEFNLPKPSKTFLLHLSEDEHSPKDAIVSIVPHAWGGLTSITFIGSNFTPLEKVGEIVSSIAYQGIPRSIMIDLSADSIEIAGFKMKKDPTDKWLGPGEIGNPPFEQMRWSIHDSLSTAKKTMGNSVNEILPQEWEVLSEDSMLVRFLGKEAFAKRYIFRVPFDPETVEYSGFYLPSQGMSLAVRVPIPIDKTGHSILLVYWVILKNGDKYLSWVGKYYSSKNIDIELSPLLAKVLTVDP